MTEPHATRERAAAHRVGEVVEAASHRLTAQCYRLYESPPLGAFVRTDANAGSALGPMGEGGPSTIYAVVCGVSTEALDTGRPIIARGEDEESEEDIFRSNPQLSRLLCTRFEAIIVGHGVGTSVNHYLPALPPRIHAFVYTCTGEEIGYFTSTKLDYLNLLVNSHPSAGGIADEVISACLREASAHMDDPRDFLVQAGKVLAVHLMGDMPRLNAILKRLSP